MAMMIIRSDLRCYVAALALTAFTIPAAQSQGLLSTKRISSALAAEAVAAAVKSCTDKKFTVSAVLLDVSGMQQAALRGDGTGPENMAIANDKAYTAVSFQMDTAELIARSRNQPPPSAVTKIPHLLMASGGVVIKVGEEVVDALAVSGAAGADNDHQCAKAGIDKIRDRLK
jgi:uncharacterized protein GlcG (DUF336 family)